MGSLENNITSADMIGGSTTLLYVVPEVMPASFDNNNATFVGLVQGFNLQSSKNVKTISQLGNKDKVNVCSRGQKSITIPIIITKAHNAICAFYPKSNKKHIIDVNDELLKTSFGLLLVVQSQDGTELAKIWFEGASIVNFGSSYTANDKGVAEQVTISWTNTNYFDMTSDDERGDSITLPSATPIDPDLLVSMDNVMLSLYEGTNEDPIGMIQQVQLQSARQITTHGEIGSDYVYQIIHDDGQGGITFARRVLLSSGYSNFISRIFAEIPASKPLMVDLDQAETNVEKTFVMSIPTSDGKTRLKMDGCIVNNYSLSINTGRNEIMEQISMVWTKATQIS